MGPARRVAEAPPILYWKNALLMLLEDENVAEGRAGPSHAPKPELVEAVNEPFWQRSRDSCVTFRELSGDALSKCQAMSLQGSDQPWNVGLPSDYRTARNFLPVFDTGRFLLYVGLFPPEKPPQVSHERSFE